MPENQSHLRDLVIACLEYSPKAIFFLRLARNRALKMGTRWRIVFLENTHPSQAPDKTAQDKMHRMLSLAAKMGGEVRHITTENPEQTTIKILEEEKNNIALLLLGEKESHKSLWLPTPTESVIRHAQKLLIPIELVPLASNLNYQRSLREKWREFSPLSIIYGLLAVGIAYMTALGLREYLSPALFRLNSQNIGLLFMTACAFSAGRFGLISGIIASIISFLIINCVLTTHYYEVSLSSVTDLLNMSIFLFAAFLISFFTSRTRDFAENAAKREVSTQVLFNLYRITANVSSRRQALEKLHGHLSNTLKMDIAFFFPSPSNPEAVELTYPSEIALNETDRQALEACWKEMKTTGLSSPFYGSALWRFKPMIAQEGMIGVMAVKPHAKLYLDSWFGSMLMTIADQVATIIEHIDLTHAMETSMISEEREKLRSMLLSSISHDLKTPLASIIGALNIYRSHSNKIDAQKCKSLIDTALGEAERLNNFITNILDMTRLESKKIEFKYGWHDPREILYDVMKRMENRTRYHKTIVHAFKDNVEVYMDAMMTGQVLQNILDNACKYTLPGTTIELRLIIDDEKGFLYEIRDHGSGIPPENMHKIFDKYARLHRRDSQVAGTGLGLAICKSIMEAQGGSIIAANHQDGGSIFTLRIPKWRTAYDTRQYA